MFHMYNMAYYGDMFFFIVTSHSLFSISITTLACLHPKTPSTLLHSPAIFQHSSSLPHRAPLCQCVGEGAHSPAPHHVLPLDSPKETTNYCTAFSHMHTLPLVSLHFLPHSITLLHQPCFHSTLHSLFFCSHFHCFWKSATINNIQTLSLFLNHAVFITKQSYSKSLLMRLRFQSSGGPVGGGRMEGRGDEGSYTIKGRAV